MHSGPLNRHERASIAWAMNEEWTRTLANDHEMPDWKRLRDAGIPGWGGGEFAEVMRHVGVDGA